MIKAKERLYEEEKTKQAANRPKGYVEAITHDVTTTTVGYFTSFIVKAFVTAITFILWFFSWVLTIVDTARYFLVQICSLIFPIFVAGLLTQSFSSQFYSFIFNVIGLFLWPVGWAIGHLGIHALFAAAANVMRVDAITVNDAASKTAQGLKMPSAMAFMTPVLVQTGLARWLLSVWGCSCVL